MTMLAYIGSRTTRERNARGDGITVCRVQPEGSLEPVQVVGDLVNPSFLALGREGDRLYTVHGDGDTCSVFAVDKTSGTLSKLQTCSCVGRNPVHLALDPQGQYLVISNHLGGPLVVLPVRADGTLGDVTQQLLLPGEPGPHRKEQPSAKPHFNPFDPSGRFVVVPDKGLDRIFVFRFEAGRLVPAEAPFVDAREGSGPRHVAFHPGGSWLYSVNELDSTVTAYRFGAQSGALEPFQCVTLLPDTFTGNSRAAEIEIDATGATLYASNRGCDTIEVFTIDARTGRLAHLQSRATEGLTPRFFALHPRGTSIYVLNEDSDCVVTMATDPSDGTIGETKSTLPCGSPVCLVFSSQVQTK